MSGLIRETACVDSAEIVDEGIEFKTGAMQRLDGYSVKRRFTSEADCVRRAVSQSCPSRPSTVNRDAAFSCGLTIPCSPASASSICEQPAVTKEIVPTDAPNMSDLVRRVSDF